MQSQLEDIARHYEKLSYFLSGSLTLGGLVDAIDHHSWIVGAVLGFMTWAANCYFNYKRITLMEKQAND